MYDTITAQFPRGKLRAAFIGNVAILTLMGYIAVMLLVLFIQFHFFGPLYEFPRLILIFIFAGAAVPGFLLGLCFAKKEINRSCWQLTNSELLGGTHGQQKFPLASIEKIIVGLPTTNPVGKVLQRAKPGTALGTSVDILSTVQPVWNTARDVSLAIAIKENSLLICFRDGSWLPLRLFAVPNGSVLMEALRDRFRNHVVESYNYSPEELRRLRGRDMNVLIPAPNK